MSKEAKAYHHKWIGNEKDLRDRYEVMQDYAEKYHKEQLLLQNVSKCYTEKDMRKHAIAVLELTKGFTGEPTDNAMKTALEMADYVMRLTNDLD